MKTEEKWEYVHDDLDCPKCRTGNGSFSFEYYEGILNGREAHKYSCTNEDCGHEEITYLDELKVNEDGTVEVNGDVGQQITMVTSNVKRVLREDKSGLYVIEGGVKNYVTYHSPNTYQMTGRWDHKEKPKNETTKKLAFLWNAELNNESKELVFLLNEGTNKILSIEHSTYKDNLSDVLLEILHYQFYIGTKTKLNPTATLAIKEANELHNQWLKKTK